MQPTVQRHASVNRGVRGAGRQVGPIHRTAPPPPDPDPSPAAVASALSPEVVVVVAVFAAFNETDNYIRSSVFRITFYRTPSRSVGRSVQAGDATARQSSICRMGPIEDVNALLLMAP